MDKLSLNGIDALTGEYLAQFTERELADQALATREVADPTQVQDLLRRDQVNRQPHLRVAFNIDVRQLDQTGWGLILARDDPQADAIYDALQPLLAHRAAQAGPLYQEYRGPDRGYRANETKLQFLARHQVDVTGPVQPTNMPYYLLLAGSPTDIPFHFQYQLDVQYAVGRLAFDTPAEYAAYAASVVAAETRPDFVQPRRAAFFSVANPNDEATNRSHSRLMQPLTPVLQGYEGWQVALHQEESARKVDLAHLLGGDATPSLLFTASHGLGFPTGDARQRAAQGALLCQDWPGPFPAQTIQPDWYFAAGDVAADARLHGLMAFFFACYGAGTPAVNDFDHLARETAHLGDQPFVAQLPQRLLSHPDGGALAVIGHIERAWPHAFSWAGAPAQLHAFQELLSKLLAGYPVGFALETFNERYAELATELTQALQTYKPLVKAGLEPSRVEVVRLSGLWTAHNDARGYVVLGDPAVRLRLGPPLPPLPAPPAAATTSSPAAQPTELDDSPSLSVTVAAQPAPLAPTAAAAPPPHPAALAPLTYHTLELTVRQTAAGAYSASLRSGSLEVEGVLPLDPAGLAALSADPAAYGRQLGAWLFREAGLETAWAQVLAAAEATGAGVRVRLRLEVGDPVLAGVRWERLAYPHQGQWRSLAAAGRFPFSRFLPVASLKPYQPIVERPLRVLAVISSPTNLGSSALQPIPAADRQALLEVLQAIPQAQVTVLASGADQPPTLAAVKGALNDGYHIVHFLCHGLRAGADTYLYLEKADGTAELWEAQAITDAFASLAQPPVLCVLMACETGKAAAGHPDFLPLGPLLVQLGGVEAVVSMADTVAMTTARRFTGEFYQQLALHGVVDRAMSEARALSQDAWDWSAPVLTMRTADGRLLADAPAAPQPTGQGGVHVTAGDQGKIIIGGSVAGGSIVEGGPPPAPAGPSGGVHLDVTGEGAISIGGEVAGEHIIRAAPDPLTALFQELRAAVAVDSEVALRPVVNLLLDQLQQQAQQPAASVADIAASLRVLNTSMPNVGQLALDRLRRPGVAWPPAFVEAAHNV